MRSRAATPSTADQSQLLRVSRDTMRRATAPVHEPAGGPQSLASDLGVLSQTLGSMSHMLESIRADLLNRARAGDLEVVDGPFTGEATQALATMDLWVNRAVAAAEESRRAVDNAHFAVSGMVVTGR